jgi:hypothetical protein
VVKYIDDLSSAEPTGPRDQRIKDMQRDLLSFDRLKKKPHHAATISLTALATNVAASPPLAP